MLCRPRHPSSGQTDFRVGGPSRRKDNSSQGPRRRLHFQLRCREETVSRCRNVNRLPFRPAARDRALSHGISLWLRIDSPMSNCCSHGTFPHFSPQSSHLSICYYHQDLHWGPFDPGSPPRLRHGPPRLPTRRGLTSTPTAGYR